jgi:hypothetical protein
VRLDRPVVLDDPLESNTKEFMDFVREYPNLKGTTNIGNV